ncbi:hypothetical protein RUM43_008103 [Polyplax serrata]|uniref:Uncharacterized protein n=1 Tax=Polyplax serrata TaxID=468196 RepID=A0AAN8S276_POLSC
MGAGPCVITVDDSGSWERRSAWKHPRWVIGPETMLILQSKYLTDRAGLSKKSYKNNRHSQVEQEEMH